MPSFTISSDDAALLARALHDAAGRHLDPYDLDFREDLHAGEALRDALHRLFPDHARALNEVADLRKALSAGFLPPPGGATPEAVTSFLHARGARAKSAPITTPPRPYVRDDDLDPLLF